MQRPFCALLTLVLGTFLACSEPKHLLGEACVQHNQCDSNYCQAGECATPPSTSDASSDSSADASPDSSQDSAADSLAPDATSDVSSTDSDSTDSFQKTDSTADVASD